MKNTEKTSKRGWVLAVIALLAAAGLAHADFVVDAIPAGTNPYAVAVNPVTNRIYVANYGSATVTVIDGSISDTIATITVGSSPRAIAVNALTNKIYVANFTGSSVSVIDGATNTVTATVSVQTFPIAIAINPATNKVYVTNYGSGSVSVINGSTDALDTTIAVGLGPIAVCTNPVNNRIYVANSQGSSVTVINGSDNSTATVAAGTTPYSIAANTVTNKIYVANQGSNNVTVIDGATNGTTTIAAGTNPSAVAVNLVTDIIYIVNSGSNTMTVIDGATATTVATVTVGTSPIACAINTASDKLYVAYGSSSVSVITGTIRTAILTVGTNPNAVAVNPITNKIYVGNYGSGNVTVLDGTSNRNFSLPVKNGYGRSVALNPVTNIIFYVWDSTLYNYPGWPGYWAFFTYVRVINGFDNGILRDINIYAYLSQSYSYYLRWSSITVNPVTNKIHVTYKILDTQSVVIDGNTYATGAKDGISIPKLNRAGYYVNPVTNKTYAAGSVVNPVTNNIYDSTGSGIDATPSSDTKLRVFFDSLPNIGFYNSTLLAQPTITGKAVNRLRTGHTGISTVLNSMTTAQFSWGHAAITGGEGTDSVSWSWTWGTDTLRFGENFLCAVALDSQVSSTNNPGMGTPFAGNVTVYPIYRLTGVIDAPVLSSPVNGVVDIITTPTLVWHTVAYATSYSVQVSTDSNFSSIVVNDSNITDTNHQATGLSINTVYYWRVSASNSRGTSPWSTVWHFTTISTTPASPVLSSPANGAIGVSTNPVLSWSASTGATSYVVQVSTASDFSTLTVNDSDIAATSHTVAGLSNFTLYYWRVRAVNAFGSSAWSEVRNFITGTTSVLPSSQSLPQAFSITSSFGVVRYTLPVTCRVGLKYYDLRGRLVATLVNRVQGAGYYVLSIKNALPSRGTYIRVFEAGSFVKRELTAKVEK